MTERTAWVKGAGVDGCGTHTPIVLGAADTLIVDSLWRSSSEVAGRDIRGTRELYLSIHVLMFITVLVYQPRIFVELTRVHEEHEEYKRNARRLQEERSLSFYNYNPRTIMVPCILE